MLQLISFDERQYARANDFKKRRGYQCGSSCMAEGSSSVIHLTQIYMRAQCSHRAPPPWWSLLHFHTLLCTLRRLLHLTAPLATSEVLAFGTSIIPTAFEGHLGPQQLSAWILAHTFINLTGIFVGMWTGLGLLLTSSAPSINVNPQALYNSVETALSLCGRLGFR